MKTALAWAGAPREIQTGSARAGASWRRSEQATDNGISRKRMGIECMVALLQLTGALAVEPI